MLSWSQSWIRSSVSGTCMKIPTTPRTGTVLAGQRRAFRAKEREKQAAASESQKPEKDSKFDEKDAAARRTHAKQVAPTANHTGPWPATVDALFRADWLGRRARLLNHQHSGARRGGGNQHRRPDITRNGGERNGEQSHQRYYDGGSRSPAHARGEQRACLDKRVYA